MNRRPRRAFLVVPALAIALAAALPAGASTGKPTDRVSDTGPYGWVNATQPSTASYTPAAADQLNSTGGTNTVQRLGTGSYIVRFAGLAAGESGAAGGGGTAFVTPGACRLDGWGSVGSDTVVTVSCFKAPGLLNQGDLVDTAFNVGFTNRSSSAAVKVSFAWADQPTAASYAPDALYAFNYGNAIKITRSATGSYAVLFKGYTSAAVAKVSAYGDTNGECRITSTKLVTAGTKVGVSCINGTGAAADSRFTIQLANRQNLFGENALNDGAASVGSGGGVGVAWSYRVGSGYIAGPSVTTDSLGARYHVRFPGQGSYSKLTVQATTVTGSGKRCVTSTITPGTDLVIDVLCFKGTKLSPSAFNLEFTSVS